MTTANNLSTKDLRKSLFDKYDPFNEPSPKFSNEGISWVIDYVLLSTREDLKARNSEELKLAYWFLRDLINRAEHELRMAATKRQQKPNSPKSEYMTTQKAILELFANYSIEDDGPLEDGTPEDYFNIFALMTAYEAIHDHYQKNELANKERDALEDYLFNRSDDAISGSTHTAMEIISFINGMKFRRQETVKSNRKSASNRHQATNDIKSQYVAWYKQNHLKTKSRNQAAIQFHAQLSEEDQRRIQPEALIRHLRAELKNRPNMLLEDA